MVIFVVLDQFVRDSDFIILFESFAQVSKWSYHWYPIELARASDSVTLGLTWDLNSMLANFKHIRGFLEAEILEIDANKQKNYMRY